MLSGGRGHSVQSEPSEPSMQKVQLVQSPPPTQLQSPIPEKPLSQSPPSDAARHATPEPLTQQAFIIEFFDDNPRKKRSQSFTHSPAHPDPSSALKAKLERRKGGERPASVHGHVPPTQQITVPLKGQGCTQRSSSLKREKTEGEGLSCGSAPRSSSAIIVRPFGSVGKKSKLAAEFAAEFRMSSGGGDVFPTGDQQGSPPTSAPPVMVSPPHARIPSPQEPTGPSAGAHPAQSNVTTDLQSTSPAPPSGPPTSPLPPLCASAGDSRASSRTVRNDEDDSLSDAGTYTIETESQDKEVEEARSMIDQVGGADQVFILWLL